MAAYFSQWKAQACCCTRMSLPHLKKRGPILIIERFEPKQRSPKSTKTNLISSTDVSFPNPLSGQLNALNAVLHLHLPRHSAVTCSILLPGGCLVVVVMLPPYSKSLSHFATHNQFLVMLAHEKLYYRIKIYYIDLYVYISCKFQLS